MNLIKIKLSMMFLLILAYNCYAVDNLCFDVLWFGKVPKADAKAKGWRQSGNAHKIKHTSSKSCGHWRQEHTGIRPD